MMFWNNVYKYGVDHNNRFKYDDWKVEKKNCGHVGLASPRRRCLFVVLEWPIRRRVSSTSVFLRALCNLGMYEHIMIVKNNGSNWKNILISSKKIIFKYIRAWNKFMLRIKWITITKQKSNPQLNFACKSKEA